MKKLISFMLITAILVSSVFFSFSTAYAADSEYVTKGKALFELGLLKGTSSTFSAEALELERSATRAEISVSVVRLLGKEAKANYQQNTHPFSDVPSWASSCVAWLYENYLVNGYSSKHFGASDVATVNQFCTMILRVLGYSDEKGDFKYDAAAEKAYKIGLTSKQLDGNAGLKRKYMISIMYDALKTPIKNSSRKLVKKLCDEKALSTSKAEALGLITDTVLADHFSNVTNTLGGISVSYDSGKHTITLDKKAEHYGIRVFISERGKTYVTEVKSSGSVYFKKGKVKYYSNDPAGYITSIDVYGLNPDKHFSFIVIKTSSEGDLYKIQGRSSVANY